jgi:hypothetical protein
MHINIIFQKYICVPKKFLSLVFNGNQPLNSAQNLIKYFSKMHINIILQKFISVFQAVSSPSFHRPPATEFSPDLQKQFFQDAY